MIVLRMNKVMQYTCWHKRVKDATTGCGSTCKRQSVAEISVALVDVLEKKIHTNVLNVKNISWIFSVALVDVMDKKIHRKAAKCEKY